MQTHKIQKQERHNTPDRSERTFCWGETEGSCHSTDLSVQQGPLAGWSFVGWQEGVVSCRSTDLSMQRDTIVGLSLSIGQEGVLSQH